MAKVNIPTISSGFASTTALNNAFDTIETELNNKVLYRNPPAGEPNQMEADLDLDSNNLLNVNAVLMPGGRRFLDTDDKAELEAADGADRAYTDALVSAAISSLALELVDTNVQFTKYDYVAVGGETFITIPFTGEVTEAIFINGVYQNSSAYTRAGPLITFTGVLNQGDSVVVLVGILPTNNLPVEVREFFTATQGQTLFTLLGTTYTLGANTLAVYLNGTRQRIGLPHAYTETSSSSFTFTEGLNEYDLVEAVVTVV
jgi:hypothetical protein